MPNSSLIVAPQSAWDTPATTGWREYEVDGDNHKTRTAPMDYKGIRSSTGAKTASNFRQVIEGGDGTISLPGFSNGLGILDACIFDSAASTLVEDGTLAYEQTFLWGPAGPPANRNITTVVRRERRGTGTVDDYRYQGGRGVSLEIGQDVDGNLMFKYVFDYRSVVQSNLSGPSITQVDPDLIYNWGDATITVGGEAKCFTSLNLTLNTNVDVDDKCIKRGDTRHQPLRKGTPDLTGTANGKYENPDLFDAFFAGELLPVVANWQGPVAIEDTTFPSLTISLGAIRFTGEDPEISVEDQTVQNLPFEILDNEDDPVVEMVRVTSDSAL